MPSSDYTQVPNIVLTGMPGSGKSTVGVILAKHLCRPYIDTDLLIQTGEGASLQNIIDSHGIEHFRSVEERYVLALSDTGTVIAPGGSVVLSPKAMAHLKASGIVVYLDASIGSISVRIDIGSRGIVKTPGKTLADVFTERDPLYREYADITFDCGELSQLEIAERLAHILSTS